jgi:hypothetical protein
MSQRAFWEGFCKVAQMYGVAPRALLKVATDDLGNRRGAGAFAGMVGGKAPMDAARTAMGSGSGAIQPYKPGQPGGHLGGQLQGGAALNYDQQMAADRQARGVDEWGRQLPFNQRATSQATPVRR